VLACLQGISNGHGFLSKCNTFLGGGSITFGEHCELVNVKRLMGQATVGIDLLADAGTQCP